MKFEKGNKLATGGKRVGAGRPAKGKLAASQIVRSIIEGRAEALGLRFAQRALGKNADRVLCKAIDKLLPDELQTFQPVFNLTFVRFDNTVQLPPEKLPITVLASDGNGDKASGEGVASEKRQGQNGLKFHNFKDVS